MTPLPRGSGLHSPSNSLPIPICVWARRIRGENVWCTPTRPGFIINWAIFPPLTVRPPLSLSLTHSLTNPLPALASCSIHCSPPSFLSPWVPATCKRVDQDAAALEKKARGKCVAAISTGRPSPLASLCQKREGSYYSQSRILTLCLL